MEILSLEAWNDAALAKLIDNILCGNKSVDGLDSCEQTEGHTFWEADAVSTDSVMETSIAAKR